MRGTTVIIVIETCKINNIVPILRLALHFLTLPSTTENGNLEWAAKGKHCFEPQLKRGHFFRRFLIYLSFPVNYFIFPRKLSAWRFFRVHINSDDVFYCDENRVLPSLKKMSKGVPPRRHLVTDARNRIGSLWSPPFAFYVCVEVSILQLFITIFFVITLP